MTVVAIRFVMDDVIRLMYKSTVPSTIRLSFPAYKHRLDSDGPFVLSHCPMRHFCRIVNNVARIARKVNRLRSPSDLLDTNSDVLYFSDVTDELLL